MICVDDLVTIRIFTAIQVSAQLLCPACDDVVNGPPMSVQHAITEALYVLRCVTAEYIRHLAMGYHKAAINSLMDLMPGPVLIEHLPAFGAEKVPGIEQMLLLGVFDADHAFSYLRF